MPATLRRKLSQKLKSFKGDEKAWPDWRYKFRVEASRCFRQVATILDWAEDKCDQPIPEADTQRVTAKENWERLNHECDRGNPF